jgi:hypothetical protein
MGIQSICRVKAKVSPIKPDGTKEAELVVPYYFRGSNVYKGSTGLAAAALIDNIPSDKFDGTMPLSPVADLIRAGILARVNITVYESSTKKRRTYQLIVDSEQLVGIYDKTNGSSLDDKDYILTKKDGTTKNMGKIIKISNRTEAYNP